MPERKGGRGLGAAPKFVRDQFMWHVRDYALGSGLSRSIIYEMMNSGDLDSVRVGGSRMITTPPDELIEKMRAREKAAAEAAPVDILGSLDSLE